MTKTKQRNPKNRRRRAKLIKFLKSRDGEKCGLCKFELGNDITLDHIKTKSEGGLNIRENLRLAHAKCNSQRYNPVCDEIDEIREQIKYGKYTYFDDFLTNLLG